jgi:hypothetical protein
MTPITSRCKVVTTPHPPVPTVMPLLRRTTKRARGSGLSVGSECTITRKCFIPAFVLLRYRIIPQGIKELSGEVVVMDEG